MQTKINASGLNITSDAGTGNLRVENLESGSVGAVNADLKAQVNDPDLQDNTPEKTKNGFFEKIRESIRSFLKLFSK